MSRSVKIIFSELIDECAHSFFIHAVGEIGAFLHFKLMLMHFRGESLDMVQADAVVFAFALDETDG